MSKNAFLVGVNNYCKSNHTMNEAKKNFLVKNYRKLSCVILGQNYYILKNNQNFYYQKWLLKE